MDVVQPLGVHHANSSTTSQTLRSHHNKRVSEEDLKGQTAVSKKRAAFGDLTNRSEASVQPSQEGTIHGSICTAPAHLACSDVTNSVLVTPSSEFRRRLCVTEGISPAPEVVTPTRQRHYIDIDAEDEASPLGCRGYAPHFYASLRTKERQKRPSVTYMEMVQNDVNPNMRTILVDWLIEVAQEYKLHSDTLYRAVDYVDRYLSKVPVHRSELQLVGVACMQVAAKMEEIYAPSVQDFVYITDNSYSADQVVDMEAKVLSALSFEAGITSHLFLDRFLRAAAAECVRDERLAGLTAYLLELSLEDYYMLQFLPSEVTASAVLLALYLLSVHPSWSDTLTHYTTYTPADLRAPVCAMFELLLRRQNSQEFTALNDKYQRVLQQAGPCLRKHLRAGSGKLPDWLFMDH